MSDQDFKFKSTVKAGPGYEAPWIIIAGETGQEWENNLKGAIASNGIQLTHELSQQFQGQGAAQPIAAPVDENKGWGVSPSQPYDPPNNVPQQQQQTPWSNAPQQPQQQYAGGPQKGQPHPQGTQCHCGKVLEFNPTRSGKAKYQCPDWRWNNGNPNNHAQEWAS